MKLLQKNMIEQQSIFSKRTMALAAATLLLTSLGAGLTNQNDFLTPSHVSAAPTCANLNLIGASASTSEDGNPAENAIDNNLNTRWSGHGTGSWISINLENEQVVCNVDIVWYKGISRTYSFVISVSDDGASYTTVYSGKSSGKTTTPERYSFEETTAKYVKIIVTGISNGNSQWVSITEIEINGYAPVDTTVPTIMITSPSDGSSIISTSGTITIQGRASDDTAIQTVEVRIDDGSYLAATPKEPGDWSLWSVVMPVTSGNHRIVPRATDNAGNQAWNSIYVSVLVDKTAPSVTITSPTTGSAVPTGILVVQGTAVDNADGTGISTVQVRLEGGSYISAVPKAAGDWSTWAASFQTLTEGSHIIYARATDKAGNYKDTSISITAVALSLDTTSPSVAISEPTADSFVTLITDNIEVTGTASDTGSGIRIVEVRVDSGSYISATPRTAGDWSTWSVTLPISAGEHRLVPRATDNAGNQAWNSIYVTFVNPTSSDGNGGTDSNDALDEFGIKKIYHTKSNGNEWYVNMQDPTSDPMFRNLPSMTKQSDGSWQVNGGTRGQVRMEAWSPSNEKWQNVEITMYAKIVSGSNELLQLYSRGGHHTSANECLGSAVKARLYGDGEARWVKEINHPAYTGNRGSVQATDEPLQGRWIGFKAVIYNFVENGKTYVRMESYIDDDVTDSNGNLIINNNWQLASVVEDRGGWGTSDSDFNPGCTPLNVDSTQQYRQRDEILSMPGGTDTQNIAAFRSDDLTWNWKYLTVREIVPPA